jgi:hypothetical protein
MIIQGAGQGRRVNGGRSSERWEGAWWEKFSREEGRGCSR